MSSEEKPAGKNILILNDPDRPMKIRHIYWFAHYNMAGPCVRYRGRYFLEYLNMIEGIPYSFVMPGYSPGNILHFVGVYFSALFFCGKNDLIVFQKIYTRGIYATALKVLLFVRQTNTVYDIDDAYYLKFPPSTIHFFLQHSAMIITGSRGLTEFAHRFNTHIELNPSPVIPHGIVKSGRSKILTVGWIGFYNAHRESFLELFCPSLERITIPVRMVILGITNETHRKELLRILSGNPMITLEMPDDINWLNETSVYRRLCEFDIGISPLLDTEYNRAKSAFKIKQCISCGIPVLASRVGESINVVEEGVNGYFCDNPMEFQKRILQIGGMAEDKYIELSKQVLQSACQFSMERYCKVFCNIFGHNTPSE